MDKKSTVTNYLTYFRQNSAQDGILESMGRGEETNMSLIYRTYAKLFYIFKKENWIFLARRFKFKINQIFILRYTFCCTTNVP